MRYPPIIKDYPHFLHGGDYNPEQWIDTPEIWDEDFRLMGLSGCNAMSIGIFSWVSYEPEEGKFTFDWLDTIMNRLAENGYKAVLATPSGAKPNWMAEKYPEIRRVDAAGVREKQKGRHNHCFTSPVYREKVQIINRKLAERYKEHPALGVWHLSNEYSGECHCDLCKRAFRDWLKQKYGTLDNLNRKWWTTFWSHSYTDWEQIDHIDSGVHGLVLDWKRFVSDQTADFIHCEAVPLRELTPGVPITTNLMGTFFPLDYRRLAKELDVVSWDNYPAYHDRPDMPALGCAISFAHDLNRSLKGGRPFMLMESSPSAVNWMKINKLLRPGIHRLKSLQAVAHGSDTVQYFQWRKSRGSAEKLHGAVVYHCGHENTRVFRDVTEVGTILKKIAPVLGCAKPAEVGIIYDWENRWILEEAQGPKKGIHDSFVHALYRPLWQAGIGVDVIGMDDDYAKYKLLIAPMLYMIKPGVAERLTAFVKNGGTLLGTFLTGIADENDLCFLGGWPGAGLQELFGVWAEEIDYLYDDESIRIIPMPGNDFGMSGTFKTSHVCDILHKTTARVLVNFGDDFYAGKPALTVNDVGSGQAYYLSTFPEDRFITTLFKNLIGKLKLTKAFGVDLPAGVTAQLRTDGTKEFIFLLNFNKTEVPIELSGRRYIDIVTDRKISGSVVVPPYGSMVLERM